MKKSKKIIITILSIICIILIVIIGYKIYEYCTEFHLDNVNKYLVNTNNQSIGGNADNIYYGVNLEKAKVTKYEELVSTGISIRIIHNKNLSENEGNKLSKYLQSFVDEDAKIEKEKYTEEALLPANYFWVAPHYGKTAQETVEKFILYIQKDDISSAMSFGSRLDEFLDQENTDNSEILKEQGVFAGQIKNLYLGLLGVKAEEKNISLEELGMTADKLVSELTPQDIHYMELVGTKEVERKDDQIEILAVLRYQTKYYLAGFTLKHTEKGWYIDSLSSESENIMNGKIKKITQDRSDALLS